MPQLQHRMGTTVDVATVRNAPRSEGLGAARLATEATCGGITACRDTGAAT